MKSRQSGSTKAFCAGKVLALRGYREPPTLVIEDFPNTTFPLSQVKEAFEALSSRRTIGKVVLVS
jgi:hypothetical protein